MGHVGPTLRRHAGVTGLVLAIASAGHGAAAGTAQLTGGPPYALRTVLSLYHLPATGLSVSPDLSLASFRAADSAVETVIAFRETAGTTLGTRIGVLFFDKALSRWSALDVPEHDDRDEVPVAGGDIDRVQATQGFVYIDLHVNPSAGVLLILSRDGKTRKGLWGWSAAVLPGDRVIYQASQEHFAPVYALELRIFDAALPGTATLYPEKPWLPVRRDYIEQVATRIGAQPGGTGVTSEDFPEGPEWFDSSLVGNIVLDRGGRYAAFLVEFGDPYKPGSPRPERVVVTCDTKTPARGPRCAEQQLADLLRGGAPLDTDSLLRRAADDAASLARK